MHFFPMQNIMEYLEYRENVLKYTNIDMNLELENDEQVLKSMQLVDDYSYYESSNVRAYLKTGTPNNK